MASCEPFLIRQLELIAPEVIVALGKFAAQTLLRTKTPITQLRGRWHDYHGIQLMPTFHPAYLLRNPGDKRLVWEDIQQVMGVLGHRRARRHELRAGARARALLVALRRPRARRRGAGRRRHARCAS